MVTEMFMGSSVARFRRHCTMHCIGKIDSAGWLQNVLPRRKVARLDGWSRHLHHVAGSKDYFQSELHLLKCNSEFRPDAVFPTACEITSHTFVFILVLVFIWDNFEEVKCSPIMHFVVPACSPIYTSTVSKIRATFITKFCFVRVCRFVVLERLYFR